ncbi:capsular polysaccharide synthesis protein [Pelagibacterium xiamenense]|uniref:capsular polysaccharide synthesis protein n=1 Tax=Pelagibacterium xiamenense TaxID=2901140 RepID=UPI001E552513|nr:capsular polysaccharide synthesis protein [Pelagibacterium xiamenense]MCD7058744.1 capsular polysaccharide synthesis protein [Pelagibacterium xiamenense]
MADLPTIVSFWHGPMGYLERLCLTSFLDHGHTVALYAYERPENLPDGVDFRDANEIVARDRIFFYKGDRTPAVFADLFRIELIAQGRGIWVDCDVYCVRPYRDTGDYLFGFDSHPNWRNVWTAQINNAVLGMPSDSELVRRLLSIFEPGAVPPGLPFWRRAEVAVRRGLGEELPVHHMQFGATGPAPLGHFVRELGLIDKVRPKDVLYPLDYDDAASLLVSGSDIEGIVTPATLSVHIWNSALTSRHGRAPMPPEPGSFIHRELRRLGL